MGTARITVAELHAQLNAPELRIIDASYFLPSAQRDPQLEFIAAHIPRALRFSIDEFSDQTSPLPHMLPEAEVFAAKVGALGIGSHHDIVVYDTVGLMGAARVWWMFRVFGDDRIRVLDGGLPAWNAAGYPTEAGPATPLQSANFTPQYRSEMVVAIPEMLAALKTSGTQIIDARGGSRFYGTSPEPRAGLRSGHIPGSANVPSDDLVDPQSRTLKDAAALQDLFHKQGADVNKPIITTCGSGITACSLAFALHEIGIEHVQVYDGSWAEWGADASLPVTTEF